MNRIEWHSEDVVISNSSAIDETLLPGTFYHLKYNDSTGYVFYKKNCSKMNNAIQALGRFEHVELALIVKNLASQYEQNIYNNNTKSNIGGFKERFFFKSAYYNTYPKTKSIFKANTNTALQFEIYRTYSQIDMTIHVNPTEKKWYQNVYSADKINGWIEAPAVIDWEFVLSAFFALHLHIILERDYRHSS